MNSYSFFRFIWYPIWGFHYGRGYRPTNTEMKLQIEKKKKKNRQTK